jgi:hypothetical protein
MDIDFKAKRIDRRLRGAIYAFRNELYDTKRFDYNVMLTEISNILE